MAKKIPQKITLTFRLHGSDAMKRSIYKWLKALEKSDCLGSEMANLYECQTAFMTPVALAALYNMNPEDFEETG